MKVESHLPLDDFSAIPPAVGRAEMLGFDGVVVPGTSHNPFMALALAAEHSTQLTLATSVAQAFVRSPTTAAYAAFDLQRFSGGRFYLALGSQVKGQIERRFGMPWTAPAARMRDYILAMRAVWACWQRRSSLNYQGTHYRLNVMTPNHRPDPLPEGISFPPVPLAAVLPYMTQLAGEICEGVRLHNLQHGAVRAQRHLTQPQEGRGACRPLARRVRHLRRRHDRHRPHPGSGDESDRAGALVDRLLLDDYGDVELTLSVMSPGELVHGCWRADSAPRRARREEFVEAILAANPVVLLTLAIARVYGELDAQFTARGHRLPTSDLLIASTALYRGDELLTGNPRHFARIPEISAPIRVNSAPASSLAAGGEGTARGL